MRTKIYSYKSGEHICINKNKDRDFESQISYFLIPASIRSLNFGDHPCKQIKTMADSFLRRRDQLEFKLIIGNWM